MSKSMIPYKKPRFVASVIKDPPSFYKDFFASENLDKVKEEAADKAVDTGLAVLVFDRKENWVVYRFDPKNNL